MIWKAIPRPREHGAVKQAEADQDSFRPHRNFHTGAAQFRCIGLNALFDSALRNTPFSVVRAELFSQTGLATYSAYAGWEDFQSRNNLPSGLIEDLKAAYPDGFEAMDAWVGILAECQGCGCACGL